MTEQKTITRRQMIEDARLAAIEGRWEDALAINQKIVDRSPRDAAAFNRIGKAHIELGHCSSRSRLTWLASRSTHRT